MMKKMTLTALLSAVLCVLTVVVSIPVGYGFVNLSDMFIMMVALVLPLRSSFLVAGIGCLFADIFLGYGQYASFTFFIKGFEAIIVYYFGKKNTIFSFILAGCFMMIAYATSDVILTGSIHAFLPSLGYNAIQGVVSIVLATIIAPSFRKLFQKMVK